MSEVIVREKNEISAENMLYELRASLQMERQRCGALAAENGRLKAEVDQLRRANRNYLKRHMEAYSENLKETAKDRRRSPMRAALYMTLPVLGLFGGTILTLLICLGRVL